MADIPSQVSFEHMLSHLFPGFFTALTVFMILDIYSPLNITQLIMTDTNAMIGFFGFIVLLGTILGVIIDGIHHRVIELEYFSSLEKEVDAEEKFKRENKIKDYNNFTIITTGKIAEAIKKQMRCDQDSCNEKDKCDFYKSHEYELLKLYYSFDMNNMDKCIGLHDYLKKSVYYYYEFYANTFISMIPFSIVAPIFMVKILNINYYSSCIAGLILAILTIICLDFAWMAYKRWLSVLYFAFCECSKRKKEPTIYEVLFN